MDFHHTEILIMADTKNHSPLPWRAQPHDNYMSHDDDSPIEIVASDGSVVACNTDFYPTAITPSNARLIVDAVNRSAPTVAAQQCGQTADIGELVKRLEGRAGIALEERSATTIGDARHFRDAARALTDLEARCAELEKERDAAIASAEKQWAGWVKEGVARRKAEDELATLRDRIEREPVVKALRQIAGIDPWDDADKGYVDLARSALASAPERVEAEPVAWLRKMFGPYGPMSDEFTSDPDLVSLWKNHPNTQSVVSLYASPPAPVVTDEISALKQALEPFAAIGDGGRGSALRDDAPLAVVNAEMPDLPKWLAKVKGVITQGDVRRARAALASREAT